MNGRTQAPLSVSLSLSVIIVWDTTWELSRTPNCVTAKVGSGAPTPRDCWGLVGNHEVQVLLVKLQREVYTVQLCHTMCHAHTHAS